ncbi:hypothetical protein [Kordia sp.]|nr:hypothetical protein [Kordia sp.]
MNIALKHENQTEVSNVFLDELSDFVFVYSYEVMGIPHEELK